MARVLVTGTSGFVGGALARSLAASGQHEVFCISRKPSQVEGATCHRGLFHSFEDLRVFDDVDMDVVVHLAAVTGGCREEDGICVNVEGTRKLIRYFIDRGCRKFVNASSIAAVGFQNPAFRPLQIPLPDEHPCLDRDGYGVSKYLMEEITRYLALQNADIDAINLRLSTVIPDESKGNVGGLRPLGQWCLGGITMMLLTDAVRAFTLATEAPLKPGVRILNTAGPKVWASAPTAEILRNWWGDDVDVSFFDQPGNEFAGVYDVSRVRDEIGFEAICLPEF
ncbi:MAG: NAD(P)-dependent oxidoreductase [Lentisphaerae bacterium]|jgi:nucleoside-diphosphate-sugar epimerase|nr:NAD(P)-dependent oxidoreductase [Lentisphaerota bacterium]MBT4821554.1 NAD(P)-dependent oxidoreductase [Lentisphaerota bacterium]MBT5604544.1 NAD(P)-dependent oxidoreductase [Lentisphaerota bacterium]MBT7061717.1 NAD(P)-dependent oxidoreductase [Lentisphaerota bacterium]MBT7848825.1 NAD(P)-dependent oxidoreductase [Lentisphaerota bacterium]